MLDIFLSLSLHQHPYSSQGFQCFSMSRQPLQREWIRSDQEKWARITLRQARYGFGVGLSVTQFTRLQTGRTYRQEISDVCWAKQRL